jgi:uncharacterized membrane protein
MFWFLFAVVILIGCMIAWIAESLEQMKTSEYEIVRVIYWFLITAFWITILVWVWNW